MDQSTFNILEVLDCYYPKFDGPTLVVTSYCKNLSETEGVSASACVPHFPNYTDNQPFPVFRVKSVRAPEDYYEATPRSDRKLRKFLAENKIDVIHVHSPFVLGRYLLKYGKKHKIPTFFTLHTRYKEDFDRILPGPITRGIMMRYILSTMNLADYMLTVSDGTVDTLREYGYKKPVRVVRNGTDLTYPEGAEALAREVDALYGIGCRENILLSVGRIVENKKLSLALSALALLKERGFPFTYLIVGDGPDKAKLEKEVAALGLEDRVIFTGKVMDRRLLSAHYLRSDLFLFPSTFDTASLSPIEAAAMKLPTVMTRGCSTAEILTEGRNGFLADETPEAWADAIEAALRDKEALASASEAAYLEVYRTWKSVADEILVLYRRAAEGAKICENGETAEK